MICKYIELNMINTPLVIAILAFEILHDHRVSVQWSVSAVSITLTTTTPTILWWSCLKCILSQHTIWRRQEAHMMPCAGKPIATEPEVEEWTEAGRSFPSISALFLPARLPDWQGWGREEGGGHQKKSSTPRCGGRCSSCGGYSRPGPHPLHGSVVPRRWREAHVCLVGWGPQSEGQPQVKNFVICDTMSWFRELDSAKYCDKCPSGILRSKRLLAGVLIQKCPDLQEPCPPGDLIHKHPDHHVSMNC